MFSNSMIESSAKEIRLKVKFKAFFHNNLFFAALIDNESSARIKKRVAQYSRHQTLIG